MNRIRQIREAQGLSQGQLGEMMGTTDATVQRIESGNRKLTESWLRRFAAALKVSHGEILGDFVSPATQGLKVLGEVQAGVWRETPSYDADNPALLPIGPDPRYPAAEQFALKVVGNSMDKVFPDGQYCVCVSWPAVGRGVKNNDLLVVHRQRAGTVESTLKRAKIANGTITLVPESHDPKWQMPIELASDTDTDEVRVAAIVIGRYEAL